MPEGRGRRFGAIVIGVSAGGLRALKILLGALPAEFPLPVLVVQHIAGDSQGLAGLLDAEVPMRVKEAEEQEAVEAGTVYLAPANYHLLVDKAGVVILSVDPPVSFARPSIDVLFEAAADVYGPELIGIILTGANGDGSHGLRCVKEAGGLAIVQDPSDAEVPAMPEAALARTRADHVLTLPDMAGVLLELAQAANRSSGKSPNRRS